MSTFMELYEVDRQIELLNEGATVVTENFIVDMWHKAVAILK